MRHNHTIKSSNTISRYDRVYLDIPQCPWLHSMVAVPLKTIYYNTAAAPDGNIDRVFRDVWDLQMFVVRHSIHLGQH